MNTTPRETSVHTQIQSIIEQRQPLAEEVKRVELSLSKLYSAISTLESYRQQIVHSNDSTEIEEDLKKINLLSLTESIEEESKKLDNLKKRFLRPTLNIGVVGLMGQGKSTLLQSLSGLKEEIPARKGGACTAVRSTICHAEQFKAEVIIHSKESFLKEVISPYYLELGLSSAPITLDDFGKQPFPSLPHGYATEKSMYDHLYRNYYENFNEYEHLLAAGEPYKLEITREQIQDYVTQQRDDQGNLVSFKHLIVKEVKIDCPFTKLEVGKIAMVDVPGLGDLRLGDESLMLETLGNKVDVVLFVHKPGSKRYGWETEDTKLYDKAARELSDLPKRSFMVLNHDKSENNFEGCQLHKNTINDAKINVVDCIIADCSDPEQSNKVLDQILKYLANHITEIDKRYAQACQEQLIELHNVINDELNKAQHALAQFSRETRKFRSLFDNLITAISNGLAELLEKLGAQRNVEDPDFKTVVDNALKACETDINIPSEEEIRDRSRDPDFKKSFFAVYYVYVAEMRTHLSQHFLTLDTGLKKSVDEMKLMVTDVLIKKGNLGELTSARDTEFLKQIADLLGERQNKLELGFRTLFEFNVSYGGLILRWIRQHLDELLTPDMSGISNPLPQLPPVKTTTTTPPPEPEPESETPNPQSTGVTWNPRKNNTSSSILPNNLLSSNLESADLSSNLSNAQAVKARLEALHKEAVGKCKQTLNKWLTEPSQVRYFMVEEFIDRVLYAKDMKKEWEIFLNEVDIRSKVWPEFKQFEERKRVQLEWLNLVQKAVEANMLDNLRFLK